MTRVAVDALTPGEAARARTLAAELELPLKEEGPYTFLLRVTPQRLELLEPQRREKPLYADFSAGKVGYRSAQRAREPLVRAVGVRGKYRPAVIDATAGLGQDAFVLASAGCQVTLIERSGIIAALLADGLARAHRNPATAESASRMDLLSGDANELLSGLSADTVYLDPMYPETGKTAAKTKTMRIFRALVGEDADADELLRSALSAATKRVVVKRPLKAPLLGAEAPSSSLRGKTTRFDIYPRTP